MDWQPIDTAPKDGTWFVAWDPLLNVNGGGPFICAYDSSLKQFFDVSAGIEEPTHWMPLPPPPAPVS